MVHLSADIPASLTAALDEKAARSSGGVSSIVTAALVRDLKKGPCIYFSAFDIWRSHGRRLRSRSRRPDAPRTW
jgi:hypothetical protein